MTPKQKIVAALLWTAAIAGVVLFVASGLESVPMMWTATGLLAFGFGGLAAFDAWGCAKERDRLHQLGFAEGVLIERGRRALVNAERKRPATPTITTKPRIWTRDEYNDMAARG